ncbi:MAG: hypothetical protein ACOX81_10010 [Candidatus Heteroscillospira sp.]
MKKLLCLLLSFAVLCSVTLPAMAVSAAAESPTEELACGLHALGLMKGISESDDGTVELALEKPVSRLEALIMVIRLLGRDAEASAQEKSHPFVDVPSWADGYVSCAYGGGLVKGVSETRLDAASDISLNEFLALLLRTMGYSDAENGDFAFSTALHFAVEKNIVPGRITPDSFTRGAMADLVCAALFSDTTEQQAFHQKLTAFGVFTAKQFDSVFPQNPIQNFAESYCVENFESYDEAMLWVQDNLSMVTKIDETDECALVSGTLTGWMHSPAYYLYLVYKDGSLRGDGTVIVLPRMSKTRSYATVEPDELRFSSENQIFSYSYHLDEPVQISETIQPAGEYQYTADLTTGVTFLRIIEK